MAKVVILYLKENLEERGFRVTLEIFGESHPSRIELEGYLPRSPEILACVQSHWEKYRQIEEHFRIKPQRIVYSGSIEQRIAECQQSGESLGKLLNSWLDTEGFRHLDQCLREELSREDTIRVLIRTDNQHLHKLPWHLWNLIESYPLAEVALSSYILWKYPIRKVTKSALRILAILGHSANIDIESDRKLLENLPHTETIFLVEPQTREISDLIWEQSWDIIFFTGHSETEEFTGEIRIYINPTESLTVTQLRHCLRHAMYKGLKLAIFNSCDGLRLARQLDDLQITLIVMRELIPNPVAQEFLKYFLYEFSKNRPFYLAVRAARERLQGLESQLPCASWLPVIYENYLQENLIWADFTNNSLKRYSLGSFSFKHFQILLVDLILTSLLLCSGSILAFFSKFTKFPQKYEYKIISFVTGGVFLGGTIAQMPGAVFGGITGVVLGLYSKENKKITVAFGSFQDSIWQKGDRIIALTAGGIFVGGTIAQIPGAIIGGVLGTILGLFSKRKVASYTRN
jgi:hypothetical protein